MTNSTSICWNLFSIPRSVGDLEMNPTESIHWSTDTLYFDSVLSLAYHTDVLVGAVCCRIEKSKPKSAEDTSSVTKLYIMTLGVLAPYRKLNIGRLVDLVLERSYDFLVDDLYL